MKSDLEIAPSCKIEPIEKIAEKAGISRKYLELHGDYKAKIKLEILDELKDKPSGKYIDVTAITPTPLGEGKTVSTIGLSLGLNKIGKKACTCIRQPSLGPVFGIKGGAAGGGYSQVLPMEDFNLHLTGDVHAVSIAHNLCSAFLDNTILKGNPLDIDPQTILWRRVMDISDRFLRKIVIGLGGKIDGLPRETGFDITVASEVMAILALTTSLKDIRERLGRIVLAENSKGEPVTAEDIKVAGAMTVLMKDALKPTLLQTTENTPAFVHAGPFANIAHGNSSILADMMATKLFDYVVTESGFGADCGMEKFMNIKTRYSGIKPDCVVMVATIRALKMHSGKFEVKPGKPMPAGLIKEDLKSLDEGLCNLKKQIENANLFGVPCVVAVNVFSNDTKNEIALVEKRAKEFGAFDVAVSEVWEKGGEGGRDLAGKVAAACEEKSDFKFLYPLEATVEEKITAVATKIYGAKDVEFYPSVTAKIKKFTSWGYGNLPVCMAKTHLSLSHDPALKGAPGGFRLPVKDIRLSAGAGFLYALCGDIRTMPGLPTHPAGEKVDIDKDGKIVGLF
ncbi:MAG: formate--tetrahydrofolate ligase [Candidatus Omnitrophica bacterium]|nr:formate--tetrahydrofolate ligase [Candidatus Omnitrophota bacterium]